MSKRTIAVLTAAVAVAATFAALAATAWADDPLPRAITHEHWNGYEALLEEHRLDARRLAVQEPVEPDLLDDDLVGRERRRPTARVSRRTTRPRSRSTRRTRTT